MINTPIDLTTISVSIAVIIGLVNGIKLLSPKVTGFYSFLLALVLGVVFGLLGMFQLTVETGIIAALASAGLYKVAAKMGGE